MPKLLPRRAGAEEGIGAALARPESSRCRSSIGKSHWSRRNDGVRGDPSPAQSGRSRLESSVKSNTGGYVEDSAGDGQEVAELHHSQEFVKEIDAPEVGQTRMITSDFKIARRSSHSEPYLTKSEVKLRVPEPARDLIKRGSNKLPAHQITPDLGASAILVPLRRPGSSLLGIVGLLQKLSTNRVSAESAQIRLVVGFLLLTPVFYPGKSLLHYSARSLAFILACSA